MALDQYDDVSLLKSLYQEKFLYDPTKEELDQGAQRGTAKDFLENISYKVNLNQIYKVVGSCYQSSDMDYCPVILEIIDPILQKQHEGVKYILQIWSKCKKIYEKYLQQPIVFWSQNIDYFIYKTEGDEDSSHYQIINCAKKCATLKMHLDFKTGFSPIFSTYNPSSNLLYFADNHEIAAIKLEFNVADGDVKESAIHDKDIMYVNPGLKIHGLIINRVSLKNKAIFVPLETNDDYQLDFSRLHFDNGKFVFKQAREVVPRPIGSAAMDPIVKYIQMFPKGVHTGVALRKSGKIDLYFDQMRIDSPEDNDIVEIGLSLDTFYFQLKSGEIKELDHHEQCEFEYIEAKKCTITHFDFNKIIYQDIKTEMNLYSSYIFQKTFVLVSHGKYVSVFDIEENKIIKHQKFESNISQLYRKKGKVQDVLETAVILDDGRIYIDIFNDLVSPKETNLSQAEVWDLEGKVLQLSIDCQKYLWNYALVQQNDNVKLFAMNNKEKFEIEGVTSLDKNTNIAYVQYNKDGQYLVVKKGYNISLYEQKMQEEFDEEGKVHSYGPPEMFLIETYVCDELKDVKPQQSSALHTAISSNIEAYVFFADYNHIYQINIKKKKITTFKNQNCNAMLFLDNDYIYTLSRESIQNETMSGLRFYDVRQIIETRQCNSYLLSRVMVGKSSVFDYSIGNARIVYINSFDNITIVPCLHRNNYSLLGLSRKYKVLDTRQVGNYFMILNSGNQLITWNILTGKIIKKVKLSEYDYSDYVVFYGNGEKENDELAYTTGVYNKSLIIKNTAEVGCKDADFYSGYQIKTSTANQKTFIDTKEKEYYRFKLVELISQNEIKEHLSFIFPYYTFPVARQELFFSSDNSLMIERLNEGRVYLYKAQHLQGNEVKWILLRKLDKFPDNFLKGSKYLSTVTPDFTKYLDIDRQSRRFKIMNLQDQTFSTYVPDDLMKLNSQDDPTHLVNRFLFLTNNTFRIVNEEGFEKIVEFGDKIVDNDLKQADFCELEFNRIPLFNENVFSDEGEDKNKKKKVEREWHTRNFFTHRSLLDTADVGQRLVRKYQAYKSYYYLQNQQSAELMYHHLFTIDFLQFLKTNQFLVDFSFSFLHWSIIEQLQNSTLNVEQIDGNTLQLLLFNILPGGNTILHRLCEREDQLKQIFYRAHPNEDDVTEKKYHIPLLPNLRGRSALHYCADYEDYKSMDTIVKYLAAYEIDHHSRAINDLLPIFIEQDLPEFPNYLDSRLQQTNQLRVIEKGCLQVDSLGIITSQIWFEKKEFDNKLLRPKPIEQRLKCEFIDCPNIHNFKSETSQEFFSQLADTENIDLFERKSIRKIITYNFPPVKEYTVRRLFIPYLFFMLVFVTYMNLIYDERNVSRSYQIMNVIWQILLAICATYFLRNEFKQFLSSGLEYLSSVWNYIDIIPPIFIYVIIGIDIYENQSLKQINPATLRSFHAIATFFMWFKLLYFMRIFRNTSYLIRMIMIVIFDMRTFLLVLFVCICAFGDSILCIAMGNIDGEDADGNPYKFTSNFVDAIFFVYRMILGDFDTEAFGQVAVPVCKIFFLLCTVFNMIVMLNLLIAIISESFAQVNENAENASYQEMASMIAENSYLIPECVLHQYDLKDKYLLVVTDLDKEQSESKDQLDSHMNNLKKKLDTMQTEIADQFAERKIFEEQVTKMLKALAKQTGAEFSRTMSITSSQH